MYCKSCNHNVHYYWKITKIDVILLILIFFDHYTPSNETTKTQGGGKVCLWVWEGKILLRGGGNNNKSTRIKEDND